MIWLIPTLREFQDTRTRLDIIRFHLQTMHELYEGFPWATDANSDHAQFERQLHYAREEMDEVLRWFDATTGRSEGESD